MDILLQDVRYAARKLMRTPSFTIVCVLTLALAIGATTAIFSIVNGVLLRPLPFRASNELVKIGSLGKDGKLTHLSAPDFIDYRERTHSFVAMVPIMDSYSANLSIGGSDPTRLNAASVGVRFFDVLGVSMQLGRGFAAGEDVTDPPNVVVLSDKVWRRSFGADPHIVGRSVSLDGRSCSVVGVASPSATYPATPDIWLPFVFASWMTDPDNRGGHFMSAVARLRPGVSVETAQRDMATVGELLKVEYPKSNAKFGGTAERLDRSLTGDVRGALLTMFGAVAFVLLIACANVANLLLVRAAGRETEIAVRTALGAGRSRIIRQLMTESVLLSLAGAMIGGALAGWSIDAMVAYGPKGLPRSENIVLDARVLAFSVAVSVVTGLLFGLVPALHAVKTELGQMLKENARGSSGRRSVQRTRSVLVVGEMALAVVLLVGAGLLIQSFVKLTHVDPGFRTDHVLTFDVSLSGAKYPYDREVRSFGTAVQDGLASIPGVQSAAVAFTRPMEQAGMRTGFDVDGRAPAPPNARFTADLRGASSNFFSTVGMHVIRGRVFTKAEETFGPPPVVVVTQAFVKKYFPNEDPIGQSITLGYGHDTAGPSVTLGAVAPGDTAKKNNVTAQGRIIGIVNDVHQQGLDHDPAPAVYVGWGTLGIGDLAFLVRSSLETQALVAAVRDRVRAVDAEMPVFDLHTMDQVVSDSVSQPRFYTALLTAFAALALLLAALGVYGVISYSVSQRTREMGIRIALGATQDRVVRLIVGSGVWLAIGGIALGLVGAYGLTHTLARMLYGVQATDGATFVGVAALLLGVASLASYLPARKAAHVDPVIAMRTE